VSEPIDEPVPKLPRGRGMKFSGPELFRIALTLIALVGVIVLTRPCASAVSGFVTGFDGSASENKMPRPGNVDMPTEMETLRPGMTDEEIKAAIERAKARAAGTVPGGPAEHAGVGSSGAAGAGSSGPTGTGLSGAAGAGSSDTAGAGSSGAAGTGSSDTAGAGSSGASGAGPSGAAGTATSPSL